MTSSSLLTNLEKRRESLLEARDKIQEEIEKLNSVHNPLVSDSDTTAPPSTNLSRRSKPRQKNLISEEFSSHFTIRSKVKLTVKMVSLLLEIESIRVASDGFTISDYFAFDWMVNFLKGNHDFHEVLGEKSSLSCYLGYIILLSFRNRWNSLMEKNYLDQELVKWIHENIGATWDRKYQSRKQNYYLSKFLEIRIVDVKDLIDRSDNSVRYTSYCKGYGEGGRSVRHQKTRFSYELDRDDNEIELPEEFFSSSSSLHCQEDLYFLEQIFRYGKA